MQKRSRKRQGPLTRGCARWSSAHRDRIIRYCGPTQLMYRSRIFGSLTQMCIRDRLNSLFQPHAMYLNLLYPVYSLIHLFPDNSTWHPVHHHRNNHTLDPSTCFLDTLYFLFNSIIASAAETFLTKTFLTL